jgi:hypothetical protein
MRVIGLLGLVVFFVAAEEMPRWRVLNSTARAAADAKDYPKLRDTLVEIKPLLPGNPRIAYNLAASEARLGHREAALAALRIWADMCLVYDIAADEDWSPESRTTGSQPVARNHSWRCLRKI